MIGFAYFSNLKCIFLAVGNENENNNDTNNNSSNHNNNVSGNNSNHTTSEVIKTEGKMIQLIRLKDRKKYVTKTAKFEV